MLPTRDLAFARLKVAFGGCPHPDLVPVETLPTGELVAWLCLTCKEQLPAEWKQLPAEPPATEGA